MSVAHGGQTVVSLATGELVRDRLPAGVMLLISASIGCATFPGRAGLPGRRRGVPAVAFGGHGADELADCTDRVDRSHRRRDHAYGTDRARTCRDPDRRGRRRQDASALGVAAGLAAGFADGCWLVELAPVTGGDEVVKAVAAAMRSPATDIDVLAAGRFSERRVLIVLDNCEHVLDAVADLVDTTTVAPDVHVLLTSREPLGLEGEQVRRVQSLDGARRAGPG